MKIKMIGNNVKVEILKWLFKIVIVWLILVKFVFVLLCFSIVNKFNEMSLVGSVFYKICLMCVKRLVFIMVEVKLLVFDNGDNLLLKILLLIIVLVIKVGFRFMVMFMLKKVILIVDVIVKVLLIVVLIRV